MKRVLQLINWLEVGGAEKLVTDLAPLIAQCVGYECDVVLLGSARNTIFEKMLQDKGINLIFLECNGLYSIQAIFRLAKLFRHYDVVHVHLFPAQLWAVLAKILSGSGVRLITTEHSTNNRRRGKAIFRPFDRFIYKRYDAVISISNDAQKSLLEWLKLKRRTQKYKVILNGVDIARIDNAKAVERDGLGIPQDAVLVMCVGRLEDVKNHRIQIDALSKLDDNFHLVLVGDGLLRGPLEEYAKGLNVSRRVHFTGIRSDVPALIKVADIAILTSRWEGLPLACVEGMSCCPFVGTDVNGIRDVVNGAGLLVADAETLAVAIKQLVDDPHLYEMVKNKCRYRALQFDISQMVKGYVDVFDLDKNM